MEILKCDVSKTKNLCFTEYVIVIEGKTAFGSPFEVMFRVVPSRKSGKKLVYRHDLSHCFEGFEGQGKLIDELRMSYKEIISDMKLGMFL